MTTICTYVAGEAEANTLCVHHLRLAAAYFEETSRNLQPPSDEFSAPAMLAWLAAMEALYPEDDA